GPCLGGRAHQQNLLFQGGRSPGALHPPGARAFGVSRAAAGQTMKAGMPGAAAIAALLVAQAAGPRFELLQPELFSAGGTLVNAAADNDGDGDGDIFVGLYGAPNRMYLNDRGVI